MLQLPKNASEKLTEVEARLRSLREEKARARKVAEAAKAAAVAVPEGEDDNAQYQAAQEAVNALKAIDAKIEQVHDEQVALLGQAGGPGTWSSMDGWSEIARRVDLERGETRVDVPLGSLLAAGSFSAPPSGASSVSTIRVPLIEKAQDNRFLFPTLPTAPLDQGVLGVVDFKQTGSREVTGEVLRDPLATTDKSELGLSLTAESEDVKQLATTVTEVPDKLFSAEPALDGFLRNEMAYALNVALDAYVISVIEASAPPAGLTGPTLIEQSRFAVAAARALGSNPKVLALDPETAADLDVMTSGSDAAYVFATRDTGSASPLWGLEIREAPSLPGDLGGPLLVDPGLAAVLYLGGASFALDPYSGFRKDTVDARLEFDCLCAIRDASGFYVISA